MCVFPKQNRFGESLLIGSSVMISAATGSTASKTLVVSRGQSRNPEKRGLEQAIIDIAEKMDGLDVVVVPHLYDLPKAGDSFTALKEIKNDIVLVSWIYSRAAHWVLDRNGVLGQIGEVHLVKTDEEVESPSASDESTSDRQVDRVTDLYPRPERDIYCLDLKVDPDPNTFVNEIRRITGLEAPSDNELSLAVLGGRIVQVEEKTGRRWYPVIDFDRCTNCMECVDFCLFGVYGVDHGENILVEQPDNCRKGCPACSRVCPENAIIFPQHKAPAIAGAEIAGDEGFKIDLSQLFGAPPGGDDPIATAARERDEQLLLVGRDAVGIDDQLARRQADLNEAPKDALDSLIDSLDEFDL